MHLVQTLIFSVSIQLLYAYLALYLWLQLIQGILTMAKNLKRRHIVKCAASGLYFMGMSPDEQALFVSKKVEDAQEMDGNHHAACQAALLTHAHGSFAWVPDFA